MSGIEGPGVTGGGGSAVPTTVQGDTLYASAVNTLTALPKNTTATRYVSNTGASNNPAWAQVDVTNGVTGDLPFANLAQGSALSVLGVTGNATADNASIVAASDGQVMRRSGTAVAFGAVDLANANAVTGVLPPLNRSVYISTIDADVTGANSTAAQAFLPAVQDSFAASADTTYRFEVFLSVTNGATTCTKAFGFGGTATFTSIRYWEMSQNVAVDTAGATQSSGHFDTAASTVVLATGTASWFIALRGLMRINGAGTLIPQIAFSADPTGTILFKKDSYVIIEPLGSGTLAAVGPWT